MMDSQPRIISRENSYSVGNSDPWERFFRTDRTTSNPFFVTPQRQDPRYLDPRYQDPRSAPTPPGYIGPRFGGPHGDRAPPRQENYQWGQQQHRVY
jgi:hypothetical protein